SGDVRVGKTLTFFVGLWRKPAQPRLELIHQLQAGRIIKRWTAMLRRPERGELGGGVAPQKVARFRRVRAEMAQLAIEYREIAGKLLDLDAYRFELGFGAADQNTKHKRRQDGQRAHRGPHHRQCLLAKMLLGKHLSDRDAEHSAAKEDAKRYKYDLRTNDRCYRFYPLSDFRCLYFASVASCAVWVRTVKGENEFAKGACSPADPTQGLLAQD